MADSDERTAGETADWEPGKVLASLGACPRCGRNHPVTFRVSRTDCGPYTHWGVCDSTGLPIKIKLVGE